MKRGIFVKFAIAACASLTIVSAAAPAVRSEPANWMRDFVRQREIALAERLLGAAAAERLRIEPKIIGGTVAPEGKWPFQVALLAASVPNNVRAQFCGGTLIHQEYVLTAAHCVDFLTTPNQLQILTGTQSLAIGGQRRHVKSIRIHPKWDPKTFDFDIALVKLKSPVSGIPFVRMLARHQESGLAGAGTTAFVTGWGDTAPGGSKLFPTKLHELKIPIKSRAFCNGPDSYNGHITQRMLCAGTKTEAKTAARATPAGRLWSRTRQADSGFKPASPAGAVAALSLTFPASTLVWRS
jgi:secreted trypsin-like serine protease